MDLSVRRAISDLDEFRANIEAKARSTDPLFFAVIDNASGRAVGYQTFMRIDAANRVIEVGNILYTPAMQRTAGATEAQYLFARYVFEELGYRRYEWKCNALNAPSRRAAERFGFTFEGIFRQHMIVKGRNRDTAWFAMLDSEWPARKAAYERWLTPENFDRRRPSEAEALRAHAEREWMMPTIAEKRARFAELHAAPGCFVIPNPFDIGSAKYLASLGFPALASTSAGMAFAAGKGDGAVTGPSC